MTMLDSSKFILRSRTIRFTAFIVLSLSLHLLLMAIRIQHSSGAAPATDLGVDIVARSASDFLPAVKTAEMPPRPPAARPVQSQSDASPPKKAVPRPIRKQVKKSFPVVVADSAAPREKPAVKVKVSTRTIVKNSNLVDANFLSPLASAETIRWKSRQDDTAGIRHGLGQAEKQGKAKVMNRDAKPRYEYNPKPIYPEVAKRRGYEGTVKLRMLVRADGGVGSVNILSSSGHRSLDRAARKAVRFWQYQPALANGIPIESRVEVSFDFTLDAK